MAWGALYNQSSKKMLCIALLAEGVADSNRRPPAVGLLHSDTPDFSTRTSLASVKEDTFNASMYVDIWYTSDLLEHKGKVSLCINEFQKNL